MPPPLPSLLPSPTLPSILRRIVESRRAQLEAAQRRMPEAALIEQAKTRNRRDFRRALRPWPGPRTPLRRRYPAVIAELKRASPSRGRLREHFEPAALAAGYQAAGAAALSVLTEEAHFEGRLEYLTQAREATRLPVLCKDFLYTTYQIWEAAAAGADAVLLIAAMLEDAAWAELLATCRRAGVAALCEVHNREEMQRAAALEADLIGVNNRDLHDFTVDAGRAVELAPLVPSGAVAVAESGLGRAADLRCMAGAGYDAVLIGERFMLAPDPGRALAQLLGGFVKICGLTQPEDIDAATAAGADAVGFVFAPSPRRVKPEQARELGQWLPPGMLRVGVFAGAPVAEILATAVESGLDRVQLHGAYAPAQGAEIAARLPVWRALGMPAPQAEIAAEVAAWAPHCERFLLDSAPAGRSGGTGVSFDWEMVRPLAARFPAERFILAGGLNPANVATAIRRAGVYGVDAASGVEATPGRKDPAAVAAFVAAARAAFEAGEPAA